MVNKNDKKTIGTERIQIDFYPGFTTSFMKTQSGTFLNVTLKNKILSSETILDYLKSQNYQKQASRKKIKDNLIERSFKTCYSNRNQVIDDITFDKNPSNTTINKDGHTINLLNYYKVAHNITIKDQTQPL